MQKKFGWAPGLGVRVLDAVQANGHWSIMAMTEGPGSCPDCGQHSTHRHGWHERKLQDLPAQGASVTLKIRMRRWRCCNKTCERQTFVERLPEIATPFARRTRRASELLHLFGHSVGGRPGERLMKRIGMPTSDDTIFRHLKRQAKGRGAEAGVWVVGIDDWAWRKGSTYGTIVVALERREVIDILPDRSMTGTANWLKQLTEIEIISRDRCGLFAQGAREGAPQARQVADRFHILQNLRDVIQAQLSRATGSSARPLLPGQDSDDERDVKISPSLRDKHGGQSIASSQEWPTVGRGKRSSVRSVRCMTKEDRSPTLSDGRGLTVARLPNGSGSMRFPIVTRRHREKRGHRELEQRPNRRADQPPENSQARDVRPSESGTLACAHDAVLAGVTHRE